MNDTYGIVVGTTRNQEWLLPWWWVHYSQHNHLPVTFFNFGDLSPAAIDWCSARGQVINLEIEDSYLTPKEQIDKDLATLWESFQPNVWSLRSPWYKKPFAMQASPYQNTIWLDLDCQVRDSLMPLFKYSDNEGRFAIAKEHEISQNINRIRGIIKPGELMYNTGVIVFEKSSKIISEWTERVKDSNHLHCSEQQLLASILNTKKWNFYILPTKYNWTMDKKPDSEQIILHYWGDHGKKTVKKFIEGMTNVLYMNMHL